MHVARAHLVGKHQNLQTMASNSKTKSSTIQASKPFSNLTGILDDLIADGMSTSPLDATRCTNHAVYEALQRITQYQG